jgi:Ca2+-binding RTX toxin-like protein
VAAADTIARMPPTLNRPCRRFDDSWMKVRIDGPARSSTFDVLEPRRLCAWVEPTSYEVFMAELINRARANPAAEAARYGIDLNEGLAPGTLSASPRQPLALNGLLNDAARVHAQWLIDNDVFQHEGPGGNNPGDRMAAAGYVFAHPSGWGENVALSSLGWQGMIALVERQHRNMFIDAGIPGRGHRQNMMGFYREIGSGIVQGDYLGMSVQIAAQAFARSGTNVFLTGVAFDDAVVADQFYTPGEGLGGVTITAVRVGDGATFSTQTWASGGYSLALSPGTYRVTASGDGLGGVKSYPDVVIGTENVKRDVRPGDTNLPALGFATLESGVLRVGGTDARDFIAFSVVGDVLHVSLGGETLSFDRAAVTAIEIYAGDGDDIIDASESPVGVYVDAGSGHDRVLGSVFSDTLTGGAGNDRLVGNGGDDRLNGSGGRDTLLGDQGNDRLFGNDGPDRLFGFGGDDLLDGGGGTDRLFAGDGNDRLFGGSSNDYLFGEAGNDTLFGQGGDDYLDGGAGDDLLDAGPDDDTLIGGPGRDTLFGGSGTDRRDDDPDDLIDGIELLA